MPRVSVIVPAYNAAVYLPDAIESVIRQTYTDWEIVVVDDGSVDNTRTVVGSYIARLQDKLQYVYQPNRGLPAARNTAIRHSRGEFIALLDADDLCMPRRLELSVAALDRNPRAGLVHGRIARIDAAGNLVDQPVIDSRYLSGNIKRHIYSRRAHLSCCTVMYRKECISIAGYFDETMRATEDRDMWFRIAEKFEVAFVDEILSQYRLSPFAMSKDLGRMLTWQRFFVEKHHQRGACSRLALHQALGNIYRERGDAFFSSSGRRSAMSAYLRAVMYNPFSAKNVYMLIRAALEPLLARVRPASGGVATRARQI
jgi:glycosyltransferase involved in cell wall biosynthesis